MTKSELASAPSPQMDLDTAIEHLQRIQKLNRSRVWRLVVRKFNPGGMTAHQTTEVEGIYAGIDWEAGRVVLQPAKPLTELTPEQVEAITQSVRSGSSWHAYQREKSLRDRIEALEAEVVQLRAQLPDAPAAG